MSVWLTTGPCGLLHFLTYLLLILLMGQEWLMLLALKG